MEFSATQAGKSGLGRHVPSCDCLFKGILHEEPPHVAVRLEHSSVAFESGRLIGPTHADVPDKLADSYDVATTGGSPHWKFH